MDAKSGMTLHSEPLHLDSMDSSMSRYILVGWGLEMSLGAMVASNGLSDHLISKSLDELTTLTL